MEELNKIKEKALAEIKRIKSSDSLKESEIKYLGRKGELTKVLRGLSDLALEEKKRIGSLANEIKKELEDSFSRAMNIMRKTEVSASLEKEWIDITQSSLHKEELGHLHPLTKVQCEIEDIFKSMGFMILDGPELESEYYNFEALNIPSWHPARDMQDTFYVNGKSQDLASSEQISNFGNEGNRLVMRTHTSPVQIRAMQKYGAPIKSIAPGRVFRSEATDASHDHTFNQVEGLMVDKDISVANLIGTLKTMLSRVFKKDVKIRLRPGYFPFVEPGFEVDLGCIFCGGAGCRICKKTGWIEFSGAGMVHPNVLRAGGVDSNKYQGFAFGFGVTRLVMMKYGINDIRLFQSGDLRFLKQF